MPRPCTCERIRPGPYTLDQCRLCYLAAHDARYQQHWGLPVTAPGPVPVVSAQPVPRAPCRHLGASTGRTIRCSSCKGQVEVKLYACAVYQDCTLARRLEAHACCWGCPDYAAAGAVLA